MVCNSSAAICFASNSGKIPLIHINNDLPRQAQSTPDETHNREVKICWYQALLQLQVYRGF